MHAIEQAVAIKPRRPSAEHGLRGGRNELHGAVAAVARDHVAHVAGQQPVAVFLGIEQAAAGRAEHFGGEGQRAA